MATPNNDSAEISPTGIPAAPGGSNTPLPSSSPIPSASSIASAEPAASEVATTPVVPETPADANLFDQFQVAKDVFTKEAPAIKLDAQPAAPPQQQQKEVVPAVQPTAQNVQQPAIPAQRDYSTLDPELVPFAKKMSNEAYVAFTTKFAKQKAETEAARNEVIAAKKGSIPDNYYENPDAVVLTPEFQQASNHVQEASIVFNHFQNQLNEVRQGAIEYKPLVRGQDGKIYLGSPVKATANTEVELLSMFNGAQNQLMQQQQKLESMKSGYMEKHNQAKNWLTNLNHASYTALNDEKNPLFAACKQTLEGFPSVYRGNPLAPLLAKAMVASGQLVAMLQQAQAAPAIKPTVSVAANGGPTMSDIGGDGSGASKNEVTITMDDFNMVKGGY